MKLNHPFYESLAHGVASVVGDLLLYFTEGSWKVSLAGQDFGVRCPPECTGRLTFDYSYGTLNSASARFDPYIGITLPGVGTEIVLRSATYNSYGDCTGVIFDHGPTVGGADLTRLKRVLSLRRDASRLLLGESFVYLTAAAHADQAVDAQANDARMIWRLRFERNGPRPGLAVKMKDHAVLRFSEPVAGRGETRNNFVIVRDGTGFDIDRVDYDIAEGSVEGSLAKFAAVIESGAIDASGVFLQLGGNSTLRFDNIDFARAPGGDAVVDATYGDIVATANAGHIALDGTGAVSELDLAGDSKLEMIGFRLLTKGGIANVTVGAGSNLSLNLSHGLLRFPTIGFTSFGAGELSATFAGQWTAGARPVVAMEVSRLSVKDASGELALGGPTRLQFVRGELRSTNLAFRSGVGLTGAFNKFVFAITPSTTVAFADEVSFQAGEGGVVDATYGGAPLELARGKFPRGAIGFTQPFVKFQAGSPVAFTLRNGTANLVLQLSSDGSFAGRGGRVNGGLTATAAGAVVAADVDLIDVDVARSSAGAVSVSGTVNSVIHAGLSMTFTSPFVKGVPDHDNLRLFPVTLTATLTSNVSVGPTTVRMANGMVDIAPVAIQLPIALTVPQGMGEHADSDDPNSAHYGGPEQDKNRQEIYTDTFGPFRVHIYLCADTYEFNLATSFAASGHTLDVNVTSIKLASGKTIGFDRDGGDLGIIGAIVGAIAGGLLFGPFGGTLGGIVGKIEGDNLNDAVNKLIAGKVAEKLIDLRYHWQVQH